MLALEIVWARLSEELAERLDRVRVVLIDEPDDELDEVFARSTVMSSCSAGRFNSHSDLSDSGCSVAPIRSLILVTWCPSCIGGLPSVKITAMEFG
jgi:hypothetical protein